jgi:hypothetical protein
VRIKVALAAGMLLIAIAFAVTLSHTPLVVVADSSAFTHKTIAVTTTPAGACQAGETVPRGTSAIRLGLTTVLGPEVRVRVLSDSHLLTRGMHAVGWEGASVTVPVSPLTRTSAPVTVCFQLSRLNGPVEMLGLRTRRATAAMGDEGKRLPGRLHIEYLRPGRDSWWSLAFSTARRLGLGRPASGSWNALLVLALATALVALSSWLVARELR